MAEPPATADTALDARVQRLATELRCLVCQNQTLADSHAPLALDLRRQVRELLARGQSEQQVVEYLSARYGDFVRYRPGVNASTALLWFGPGLMLAGGLGSLLFVLRRRSRMAPEHFDAATDEEPAAR